MVNKLMVEQGFYIIVDIAIEENLSKFTIDLGPAYIENNLSKITITDDGKFVRYFENDVQKFIRDTDLSNKFETTVTNYMKLLLNRFPKKSILRKVDGELINYFDEE